MGNPDRENAAIIIRNNCSLFFRVRFYPCRFEAGGTAIPSLAEHATTVVGRGISLWVAIQSLSQLEAVYGKARAQVLKDNMDSQIYYRPTDLATAEYLEERLGD